MYKIFIGTQSQILGRELTNKELKEISEFIKQNKWEKEALNRFLSKTNLPKKVKFEILLSWKDIINTYKKAIKRKNLIRQDYLKIVNLLSSVIKKHKKK